jgi:hypothetical protein
MRAAFLLGLLLAAAGVTAPAAAGEEQRLFVDGDSLAVGTQPYFPEVLPGWDIRTSAAVSLGTNDDPRNTGAFRSAIRDVMAVAGPSRCVVWATIQRPPVAGAPYTAYNAILRAEGRRRPNLKVVRWRRLARAHPEWLGPDRVHVDGVGYRARARAYADQIRHCP